MHKKIALIFIVFIAMLVVSIAYGDEILLSNKKASYEVTTSGKQLIQINYEDVEIQDLAIKGNSDKSLLYYLDYDGVYVIPKAPGKTKLTISSKSNKKMKLDLEVTVLETAVDVEDEAFAVYAVIDHSYIQANDKVNLYYYIRGGKGPYNLKLNQEQVTGHGSYVGYEFNYKNAKPSGKIQLQDTDNCELLQPEVIVTDSDLNIAKTKTNVVVFYNRLAILPDYIPIIVPANEQVTIPYKVLNGKGSYSVSETYALIQDYDELNRDKTKTDMKSNEGSMVFLTRAGNKVNYRLHIYDKKTKQYAEFNPALAQISANESAKAYIDKTVASIGEPITMRYEFSEKPKKTPSFAEIGYFSISGNMTFGSDKEIANREVTKIDECTYEVVIKPKYEGFMWAGLEEDMLSVGEASYIRIYR